MPGAGCPGGRGPEAGEAGPLPRPAQPRPAEAAVARAEVTRPGEGTTCSAASAGPPQQKYKYFFDRVIFHDISFNFYCTFHCVAASWLVSCFPCLLKASTGPPASPPSAPPPCRPSLPPPPPGLQGRGAGAGAWRRSCLGAACTVHSIQYAVNN